MLGKQRSKITELEFTTDDMKEALKLYLHTQYADSEIELSVDNGKVVAVITEGTVSPTEPTEETVAGTLGFEVKPSSVSGPLNL